MSNPVTNEDIQAVARDFQLAVEEDDIEIFAQAMKVYKIVLNRQQLNQATRSLNVSSQQTIRKWVHELNRHLA